MADRYVATSATPGTDVDGLGGGAVAAGDISDAGTVGVDLVQSETAADALAALGGAAALRALLFGPYDDDMSGADWAALSATGGATATWATGPARLVLDCVSGAAGSCGVRGANYLPSGDSVTVAIRLRVVTGDNSNQTRVTLSLGRDASNNINLIFYTDGSIECGFTAGGSYTYWRTESRIAGIDATARTGGNLWLRLDRAPLGVLWSWGVRASGARPTAWHPVFSTIEREVAGYWSLLQPALYACNGSDLVVSVRTLSAMNLSVDVLAVHAGLPGAF